MEAQVTSVTAKMSPLEQENQVIEFLERNWQKSPKKMKAVVSRIYNDQPLWIQRGMLDGILNAVNPSKMVVDLVSTMAEWKVVIPNLIADGNHGMLVLKGGTEIHGVTVKARDNWLQKDQLWNEDQEHEIQTEIVKQWMAANNKTKLDGMIVLFDEFGFSGIAKSVYF